MATPGRGGDLSTTCVIIWFVLAVAMFLIDFSGESEEQTIIETVKNQNN